MIQHVCLIKYNKPLDQTKVDEIIAAYNQLPELIPGIVSFQVGADAGLLEGNADLAIVGQFKTKEDFAAYSVHPAQAEVVFPILGEHMDYYSTAQFEV